MRAERRVVTVLAADVVGSTALAERLGAEDARVILGETLARAVTVVEAYGGTVKDLAGDGILALFGAPVAHDDDAERAARAALDIAADVERQAADVERGWGLADFAIRLGLHTGEVVVGAIGAGSRVEYGASGDTVNTAARLQAVAPAGAVLASAVTTRLVQHLIEVGPEQKFELKGKAEPVLAHLLTGVRSHAAPRGGHSDVLVGRDAEAAAGRAALERLATGVGGVLWIVGDPGLGKTRLLAELTADAATLDVGWAEGRCASYGEALPYWPIRDLLNGFFGVSVQDPELKRRLGVRRRLEALLPDQWEESLPYLADLLGLGGDQGVVAPEALQFRTFEVMSDLVGAWVAGTPGVLVIDDLHWADAASLALIESLLPLTETEPLLMVFAMRPETGRLAWGLRERALREYRHISAEIDLRPLSAAAEAELISHLFAGVDVPEALIRRLRNFAGGNPFYLEELVQGLGPDRHLAPAANVEIPETLEAVILARVDRLEPEWRAALAAAAPLGRTFGLPLLDAVCDLDGPAVRQALHHLRRLDLLTEEARLPYPTYRFKHALIQEAVYRSLLGEDRALLHRRAAEWLTDRSGARPEALYPLLAHHWLAASDTDRAMTYARLAGDQARDNNALDEAIAHYRTLVRLLDETERGSEAADPLYQLGTTLLLASRFTEAQDVWDRAFALPRPAQTAPVEDVELRIMTQQLPWDVNPAHGYFASNEFLIRQLYDSLIEPRPGPALTPGMAERWHISPDGREITLWLRPELRWSDGTLITAHQIVESVSVSMLPAAENTDLPLLMVLEGAAEWIDGRLAQEDFAGIVAIDERTVRFRLRRPAPHFMFVLTYPSSAPFSTGDVITGAFHLERMDEEAVVIARNRSYTRRRGGNVGRVTFSLSDGPDADAAFRRGEVDIGMFGSEDPDLRDNVVLGGPVMSVFLVLNARLTDLHLRRALAAATDREVIGRHLRFTDLVATGGLVPAGLAGHTPDIAVAFDPDAARAALAQSSALRPGEPLQVWNAIEHPDDWWDDLINTWREVLGIRIDVILERMVENVGFAASTHHGAVWHWVAGYPDPDYFLRVLLHSKSATNSGGWHDERFDHLIDQTMESTDGGASRLALFHEADRLAVREGCAVIPLTYRRLATLVRPGVDGWWQWGAPMQSLDSITVRHPPA